MCITKWEKPKWKSYAYDSITHSRKGKTMERMKASVVPRSWEEERMNWRNSGFLGQWNYPRKYYNGGYVSFYVWANSQNGQHQAANSNVNYGFGVMMCLCRFIHCNKWTTLVVDADYRRGYVDVQGGGKYWVSPYLFPNFARNLKL